MFPRSSAFRYSIFLITFELGDPSGDNLAFNYAQATDQPQETRYRINTHSLPSGRSRSNRLNRQFQ